MENKGRENSDQIIPEESFQGKRFSRKIVY